MKPYFLSPLAPALVSMTGALANFPVTALSSDDPFDLAATSNSGTVSILFEFTAPQAIDSVSLLFHDLPDSCSLRLRGASTRAAVTSSPLIDQSGPAFAGGGADLGLDYNHGFLLLPAAQTARYFQLDILNVPAGGFSAGRLLCGNGFRSERSIGMNFKPMVEDASRVTVLRSGTRQIDRDRRRRGLDFSLKSESLASAALIDRLLSAAGSSAPLFVCLDPEGPEALRRLVFGYLEKIDLPVQRKVQRFTTKFKIASI